MKHKLIFNTALLFVLCLLLAGTVHAQSRTITLKESVDLTLANNKALKIDSSKIIEAATAITEAREKFMPDVSITGSGLFLPVNPGVNLKTGGNNNNANP